MKIGFTGTKHGMTAHQRFRLEALLRFLDVTEFHHGDCIGADAEAHAIAQAVGIRVVVHPPEDDAKRAFVTLSRGTAQRHEDDVRVPRPYLRRNLEIVRACDLLIAAPRTSSEQRRSGTWATIRCAGREERRVEILDPRRV